MNIDGLKEGMKVANYKALCGLLKEPVKGGKSKEAQLKELSRHCKYTRSGNAYLIEEIYEVPTQQRDGRQKYLYLVEPILLNYIADLTHKHGYSGTSGTWNRWFQDLGMVDSRLYDDKACEKEVDIWKAHPYSLYRLKNIAKNGMRDILKSALSNLKKRGVVDYREQWRIVLRDGFSRVADDSQVAFIEETMQTVVEEMGYSSVQSLILSPQKYKQFCDKSREQMLEARPTWRLVFREVRIDVIGSAAEPYFEFDVDPLKKELNRKICASVLRAARREAEKQEKRELQLWEEGVSDQSTPRFLLPWSFEWDADVLVDQLMFL